MNTYDIGDLIQVTAEFTGTSGAAVDPTTVTFAYQNPDTSITSSSVTRASTGVYTAQITTTMAGTYNYRFQGVGAVVAANEGSFLVNDSPFV